MRKLFVLFASISCLFLAACGERGEAVKGLVYDAAAKTGNKYCKTRDEEIVNGLKRRIKTGLENADPPAEFELKVEVNCF